MPGLAAGMPRPGQESFYISLRFTRLQRDIALTADHRIPRVHLKSVSRLASFKKTTAKDIRPVYGHRMRPEDVYTESPSGMSAEPRRVTNPEVWTRWEGQVVKGVYPLRRFLGGSGQGAVFLSTYDAGKPLEVAIKIAAAVGSQAEARLAHWRTAAALSHPNLVRLFDMGRCQLAGREFLFIVMEHGEQTLAEF